MMPNFRKRPLVSISSCGLFDRLPREIQFHLFDFLPLADVGNFALASEGCRLLVAEWIPTKRCLARALLPISIDADSPNKEKDPNVSMMELLKGSAKFNPFAVLVKRMTCLLNTRERIRYAFEVFDQTMAGKLMSPHEAPDPEYEMTQRTKRIRLSSVESLEKSKEGSQDWEYTVNAIQFFTMLHTFVRGWDDSEFPLLLDEIEKKFKIKKKIQSLFECRENGQEMALATEMELRLLSRCLTWDVAGNDYGHRASWLIALMNYFVGNDARHQAMVLLLMFGPACQDSQDHYDHADTLTQNQTMILTELNNHTDWEGFIDNVPGDFHEGKEMFYALAQAVCSCLSSSNKWKKEAASLVLDEMFVIPSKWKRENIAGFLLFCSEPLILHYMQSKLDCPTSLKPNSSQEGNIKEASRLLVDMIVMSHKFENVIEADRGIGKVFDIIAKFPSGEKLGKFHEFIWDSIILEVQERHLELEDEEHFNILKNLGLHIMKRAYIEIPKPIVHKSKFEADADVENPAMEVEE